MAELLVTALTCEYRTKAIGIDAPSPRFTWQLQSDRRGTVQQGYRLVVAEASAGFEAPVWDTGYVESDRSVQVAYEGPALRPRTVYAYRVKVWDASGRDSEWSETASFETGLMGEGWQAEWITPSADAIDPQTEAAFLLRKQFELRGGIVSARIYATAAGVYELYVNGQLASEDVLAPGWTSYHNRLQYQTYDVTALVREGGNGIGLMLGDGWYRSGMGFEGKNFKYGDRRAALAQLCVRFADGSETVVATDGTWKAATAPVVYSTIYHGETYDARLTQDGWHEAGFDDTEWAAVERHEPAVGTIVAQENWPTRVTETLRPVSQFVTPAGALVLDFGQNLVGRMRFTVKNAPAGTTITLRHAEVLDKDGNIYYGNLRPAKQIVKYIAQGAEEETYAPHFTFQGFRYVQVEGYPGQENGLPLELFAAEVLHSDMPRTGEFECSDERINQLQRNIQWGQRGNFLDVPTDCPQRDERLGWTGDAQVFIGTALFNFQGGPFFTKWLRDMQAEQLPNGGIPFVIPDVVGGHSSAAWGDAAVICPWTTYRYYDDLRLLEEQYGMMKAWVEYIRSQGDAEFLWNTGFHFGDWLALDAKENSWVGATPRDLIATAYFAYSTRLVRDAAAALGKEEDVAAYSALYDNVVRAFRDEFVSPNGRITSPTQTAHVLALAFELVDEPMKSRVARDLNDLVVDNDYHLTTGFVGTPYLCFALSSNGYHDTAVKLLLQESYPGWLYSVSKGATTIWEHWDSIKPDGSFWSDDMNSFNHYAYGAIGEWMYRKVAGLDLDAAVPGFKRLRIEPLFGAGKLTQARAAHETMYGAAESAWRVDGARIEVRVRVPANATAEVVLRGATAAGTTESGAPVTAAAGVADVRETESGLVLNVGSGEYTFVYENADLFRVTFTEHSKLCDVLSDPRGEALVKQYVPELFQGPAINFVSKSSLKQIAENGMLRVSKESIAKLVEALSQ